MDDNEKSLASVEQDILNNPVLLEKIEAQARTVAMTVIKHEMHSGPLPSPKLFAEYDAVLPGTALSIRNAFEKNGEHVRNMESQAIAAHVANDIANRKVAERLVWASLGLIGLLAITGHESVAIAVAVTTVIAVITGFLNNKASASEKDSAEN